MVDLALMTLMRWSIDTPPRMCVAGLAQPAGTAEATADGGEIRGASDVDERVQVVDRR
jgi:hypothetical protein